MNSSILFAIMSLVLSCHLKYTNAEFRIRGGEDINIERTPHTVAFFHQTKYRTSYICAGSLVSMRSVVTVAHQFVNRKESQLFVLAGVTFLSDFNAESGQIRSVDKVYYCDFDQFTHNMDIAVVKVDAPFFQTETVKSISLCLNTLEPGLSLEVSGWGSINSDSLQPSNSLKTTKVPIMARTQCESIYASRHGRPVLAETLLCARYIGRNPCYGDAGAAGVLGGRLCAVVQGGSERGNIPTLFTNVTHSEVNAFLKSFV